MQEDDLTKKSRLRSEVEALLKEKGFILESRITVANMDTGEAHYFESYNDAMDFLRGRRGRWYITTPGIRYSDDEKRG
jgi:hypothetical protein